MLKFSKISHFIIHYIRYIYVIQEKSLVTKNVLLVRITSKYNVNSAKNMLDNLEELYKKRKISVFILIKVGFTCVTCYNYMYHLIKIELRELIKK